MCGRYYVDDETARAMEALLRGLQGKIRRGSMAAVGRMAAGDVHPSEAAPVLWGEGGAVRCGWQRCLEGMVSSPVNGSAGDFRVFRGSG